MIPLKTAKNRKTRTDKQPKSDNWLNVREVLVDEPEVALAHPTVGTPVWTSAWRADFK
jgi:hypothetical protein